MDTDRQRNDALDELALLLRTLRSRAATNNTQLAARTGFKRQQISRAMLGQEIPSVDLADALEVTLSGEGTIRRLRDRAEREKKVRALGFDPREEDDMDATRRGAFGLAAAGLIAADTFRQWRAAEPDILTLDEIDDAISAHAAAFTTEPHSRLAPQVWKTWESAHTLLQSGGGRARAQTRLTIAAGYASYMLCRLAFNLGDPVTSRRFLRLASDHADQGGDVVLTASVGEMLSTLAFYGRRYHESATAAQRTTLIADDDYTRARIAAYEARALAALGDGDGTRTALNRMRTSVVDRPAQPGCSPFSQATADMFEAGVLARIGAGVEAEPIARRAVEAYGAGRAVGFEDHGGALLALAWSLTSRPDPAVDEAATIAGEVVGMLDDTPTASVAVRAMEVADTFREHPAVEPVRDFWDHWQARPRLELTAGQA